MMFKKNQRICLKSNPEKRGIITTDAILVGGYSIFRVMFDDGKESTVNEVDLMHEIIVESAWDKLANNLFGDYRNYAIASTVNKITNASANTISTLKASKTIFKPYQFIPLVKLLNSSNQRIIIADEVGLGKTIEAGHIILEFAARGKLNNFLIVCLNSIQEKWKDEMENKFNIKLKIYESLREFKADIKEHHANGTNIAGIINYDKFRSSNNSAYFEENAVAFDMIVFDEAHHLRNPTNARKALKNFTSIAKSVVMLTATPMMTGLDNLYNLIHLLDEREYSKYEVFQNNININKPFIRAFNEVSTNKPLAEIASNLKSAEVENVFKFGKYESVEVQKLSEILKDDPLFQSVLQDFETKEDTRNLRTIIKQKLVNLNRLNHIYSRTRKSQVLTDGEVVTRNANVIPIKMTDEESEIYEEVVYNYADAGIGAVQKKRSIASSLFANNYSEAQLSDNTLEINQMDSKYKALKDVLKENPRKIIVFSFFRKTLLYLKKRLTSEGFKVGLIFGGLDVKERNKIIDDFRNGGFDILLASEVGSTGLDMQFCDCMVNYDLPWNPMVVEQRIGRIDRIGQQSEVINIFNLIHTGTIEDIIYERLYNRINIFRESLGNLDEILGERENYFEGLIEELYKTQLTDEQREQKLDVVADAVLTNKHHLQDVEEKLKDSFSNDAYFANEIKSIEQKRKYIQSSELRDFIDRIIANHLTTMTFNPTENEFVYKIQQVNSNDIFQFVQNHYDQNNFELTKMFRDFRTRNFDRSILLTFDQDYAFRNKNIEYISGYHPLINAISNYFETNRIAQNTVYRFSVDRSFFDRDELRKKLSGEFYFLINYNFSIKKMVNKKITEINLLKSLLIDLEKEENIVIDDETAELLNSEAQKNRQIISSNSDVIFNKDFADFLSNTYMAEVYQRKNILEKEEKLVFDSEVMRKTSQEISEIEKRIERLEYNLDNKIGLENPQLKEISELELRKDKLMEESEKSSLEITDNLVSLNLIQLYG